VQKSVCRESAFIAPLPAATLRFALASIGITITDMAATVLSTVRRFAFSRRNEKQPMNTKQKAAIGFGLAVVIAMALYPPWATWCVPVDHKTLQLGFGNGSVIAPIGLGDRGDGGVDGCIPVTDTGRTRLGMNALRHPEARHAAILPVNLPSSIFLHQEMIPTTTAQASTMVPYVYQSPCPVSVEPHGGNVKDYRSIEGKAIGGTRSLLNRFHVRRSD
jgi:hypothetical protein